VYDKALRFFLVWAVCIVAVIGSAYSAGVQVHPKMITYTFEQPPENNSEWTGEGGSEISDRFRARTGSNAAWLFAPSLGDAPLYRNLSGLTVGEQYSILLWVTSEYLDSPKDMVLRLTVGDDPGAHQTFILMGTAIPGIDWSRWSVDFTPTTTNPKLTFSVSTIQAGGYAGIDDVVIAKAADMKKWDAINGSITVLKGITAAGNYNNDLGSRVYTRLFTPQEQREVKLPYACLPVDQEAETIEYEGQGYHSTFVLTGHAFFADNSESDPLNSTGAIAAARFRDDLIRAFLSDTHLGNTTSNCEVTRVDTSAGIIDDGVSEVQFTVEFTQYGGAANLAAT
jgi:hypothetical protein